MPRKKMMWQLILPFLIIVFLSILIVSWYSFHSLRVFYYDQARESLYSRASLIRGQFAPLLVLADSTSFSKVDSLCRKLGAVSSARITIMLPDGRVVGDSEEDPARMENHAMRKEMAAALSGRGGTDIRLSNTLQSKFMYHAEPIFQNGEIIGVVRTSTTVKAIDDAFSGLAWQVSLIAILVAVLAGIVTVFVSRRISRPLEELRQGAESFARGELDRRLRLDDSEEIGDLADAMNQMASQLDERIATITRQRNEQQAVLASMVEGVFAVDIHERILHMNGAAARLLDMDRERVSGRSIQETVRNIELQKLIASMLKDKKPREGEVTLTGPVERYVQVHATVLKNALGVPIGGLIVLNDLTRLKRLENVRREFVANVSHELKTPITSIKGFVETLLDGALESQADARRFLQIIGKQADRLGAIINDLLSLSRIEQEAEAGEIDLKPGGIKPVLQAAAQVCQHKAEQKHMRIDVDCSQDIRASINAPLLEQAVVNLIDNAIKYSGQGSKVLVRAADLTNGVKISVEDNGSGIPKENIPRLFERFYRVDKARSRELGGTGLGLAIVKHIVIAHKGTVEVMSEPGQGSTFSIIIPGNHSGNSTRHDSGAGISE